MISTLDLLLSKEIALNLKLRNYELYIEFISFSSKRKIRRSKTFQKFEDLDCRLKFIVKNRSKLLKKITQIKFRRKLIVDDMQQNKIKIRDLRLR